MRRQGRLRPPAGLRSQDLIRGEGLFLEPSGRIPAEVSRTGSPVWRGSAKCPRLLTAARDHLRGVLLQFAPAAICLCIAYGQIHRLRANLLQVIDCFWLFRFGPRDDHLRLGGRQSDSHPSGGAPPGAGERAASCSRNSVRLSRRKSVTAEVPR